MATVTKDFENGSATWTFSTGAVHTVTLGEFGEKVVNMLALHGLVQKGSDPYAGKSAGEAEEAFLKAIGALRDGKFNVGRAVGAEKEDPAELVISAWFNACQANPKYSHFTREQLAEKYGAMDANAKRKLRRADEVARAIFDLKKPSASLDDVMMV